MSDLVRIPLNLVAAGGVTEGVVCAVLISELDALEAERAQLVSAIRAVLADDESAPGGWGPDITTQEYLRVALASLDTEQSQ